MYETVSKLNPARQRDEDTTEQAILKLIASNVQRVPLAIVFLVLVIVSLCYSSNNRLLLGLWAAVVIGLQYVRYLVLPALVTNSSMSGKQRLFQATVLSFINGLVFASAIYFFADLDDTSKTVFSIVYLGLAQATITTGVGYRPIILAFAGPFLIALTVAWLFTSVQINSWVPPAMSILIALYSLILLSMAGDIHDSFLRAHHIQFQLQDALASEKEANAAKTRFLAAASHDLRQPLHTLSLYSAALTQRPLDNKSAEIANSMNEALTDLANELDSLLDVSKLDAGIVQFDKERFDCETSIRRVVNTYRAACQQKGIAVNLDFQIPAAMYSDRIQFERAIRNIMENAVKYTDSGTIDITLRKHGPDHFKLIFRDSGIGISEDDKDRVFQEFYQTNNPERDRTRGLGLGLSIVARLTPMLGGKIELESSLHEYTQVTFTFPLAEESTTQASVAPISTGPSQAATTTANQILIVDDDIAVRNATRELFEGIGCTVTEASNTADAIASVTQTVPDIALVDLRLPMGESGIDTVRQIRQIINNLPAIIITGETSPQSLTALKNSGFPYLSKPIHKHVLLQTIKEVLSTGKSSVIA